MSPKILIATTTWWAMPARLALAFANAGSHVSGIFPRGNPLGKVRVVEQRLRYSARKPLASLKRAIKLAQPDLIVPCDDRAVEHLHRLYQQESGSAGGMAICHLIERSLGAASGYSTTTQRARLLELARDLGIRIPESAVVRHTEELRTWLQHHGTPAVLKIDGTWGGSGVRIVHSEAEAEEVFQQLTRRSSFLDVAGHLCFHDFFPVFSRAPQEPQVTVQKYIKGYLSNAMFVCWEGQVLDELGVDVVFSQEELGASTIVRTINNPEMTRAGHLLVKSLGVSGFCGLDFITDAETGAVYLLEMNPRATQLGHLEPGGRHSLVNVLHHRLMQGTQLANQGGVEELIALFPQVLRCDPANPLLANPRLRQDLPQNEPELTRELMRQPWNRRHLSASVYLIIKKLVCLVTEGPLRKSTQRPAPKS